MPSGASRLNPPPRPGTTSITSWVCFQASNCGPEIHIGTPASPTSRIAEQDVAVADDEVAVRVAHRRRPVAAAAGLVEHQRAVAVLQSCAAARRPPR